MVGDEVDEHGGLDGDGVVAAVVVVVDAGELVEALGAVDGEAAHVVAELGAVADEVLGGEAVGELGQHLRELGVDGGAVVALHEVLDDELPVGLHVVGDPPAQGEVGDVVALDGLGVPEALLDVAHDVLLEGRRVLGQADPDVAEVLADRDGDQAVLLAVDVGHLGEVGGGDELAVEVVGPGVVRALEGARGFAGVLHAQLHAAVAADVVERPDAVLPVAGDDDGLPPDLDGAEGSGLVQVGGAHGAEPHLLEDALLLGAEDCLVHVGGAGQGGDQGLRDNVDRQHELLGSDSAQSAGWEREEEGQGCVGGQAASDWTAATASFSRVLRQRQKSLVWFQASTATGSSPA